jgi:predicted metalloendopeptidase
MKFADPARRRELAGDRHRRAGPRRQAGFGTWGYDRRRWTAAVKPGDDFFDYVNGAWAKRTEIAADRTFVGIDSVLNDQIDKDVRAIVEDMAKNPPVGRDRPAGRRFLRQLDGRAGDREAPAPRRSSPISRGSRR